MEKLIKKTAYIKGLCDGLNISDSTNEGKVLLAIVDLLEDMTEEMIDLRESYEELDTFVDAIDESVSEMEEYMYEDEFYHDHDCGCCDDEEDYVDITCPNCEDSIVFDKEMLEEDGEISCPNCGKVIIFEASCGGHDCSCEDETDK